MVSAWFVVVVGFGVVRAKVVVFFQLEHDELEEGLPCFLPVVVAEEERVVAAVDVQCQRWEWPIQTPNYLLGSALESLPRMKYHEDWKTSKGWPLAFSHQAKEWFWEPSGLAVVVGEMIVLVLVVVENKDNGACSCCLGSCSCSWLVLVLVLVLVCLTRMLWEASNFQSGDGDLGLLTR